MDTEAAVGTQGAGRVLFSQRTTLTACRFAYSTIASADPQEMPDLAEGALNAKRESKYVESKERFDPRSAGDWCEVIKDIAVIAFWTDVGASSDDTGLLEFRRIAAGNCGSRDPAVEPDCAVALHSAWNAGKKYQADRACCSRSPRVRGLD